MARTPAQRGPFGRWLKAAREERYETQAQAIAELRRLAGISISPSEFAQWESGSRVPRDDNPKVARLYEFFGSTPALEATETPDDLVAALRDHIAALAAQTAMMGELVRELREARQAGAPTQAEAAVRAFAAEHEPRPHPEDGQPSTSRRTSR